jgi:hypothetical protein
MVIRPLGPDGFSLAFSQTCREVIKEDFMNVFQEFHLRSLKRALLQLLFPSSLR